MKLRGVVFDLGGVVFESPLEAIARFEENSGLPPGLVNRVVQTRGEAGAWARHERGELTREEFLAEFSGELAREGFTVDTARLMREVEASMKPRPRMLAAVARVREAGYRVAALTNNWEPLGDRPWASLFDVFCESVVEGVRKPEPEIYRRCLSRLGVEARETLMLDDLGPNLKTARELGMMTIKVTSEAQALAALADTLGVELQGPELPSTR